MPPKVQQSKAAKALAASKSSKAKKKKWSKGKTREKLVNAIFYDQETYDKLLKEVPTYKLVTPAIISERLRVNGSLARVGIKHLLEMGKIKPVIKHSSQLIYTRSIVPVETADEEPEKKKSKKGKKEKADK